MSGRPVCVGTTLAREQVPRGGAATTRPQLPAATESQGFGLPVCSLKAKPGIQVMQNTLILNDVSHSHFKSSLCGEKKRKRKKCLWVFCSLWLLVYQFLNFVLEQESKLPLPVWSWDRIRDAEPQAFSYGGRICIWSMPPGDSQHTEVGELPV